MDANLDQARAYLVSILSHPKSPHNLATIALRIIFQIGRVRSSIEDMLVVCDLLDKYPDIDLREDLYHLKVKGEFKEEDTAKVEESFVYIDPPFTENEKFNRITAHSSNTFDISKAQFSDSLSNIKLEAVTDGAFIYVHSPTIGLMKLKRFQESIEILIHKPPTENTAEARLALVDGKLFLRNLHEPTFLKDQDETGAIQFNCETLDEISISSNQDEGSHHDDDDDDSPSHNDDEDNEGSDEDEDDDHDDEDNSGNDEDDDGGDDDDDNSNNSEEDDDDEHNIMFLEVDTPVEEKMFQETPLMSDGKYLYVISMNFTEEEIEKANE
jgi:hypothetical protein